MEKLKNSGLKYRSFDSVQARISGDIEVDSFLCQMIGTVDSLLFKINGKFRLGIPIDRVEIDMYSGLSAETTRIELLADLDMASQHGNWYWMIKQLKNYSLHDSLISSQILELVPDLRPE